MKRIATLTVALVALTMAPPVHATWSIVVADKNTKEFAIGSVTCLNNFDLRAITPVVLVGIGGGAVQAAGDFNGIRRPIIRAELLAGTDPQDILDILAGVGGHQSRQYGVVDTLGRTMTFSGNQNAQWAGGVTGEVGNLSYAIQGNILAGSCVVPAVEGTLLSTPGDIPAKLMAAMETARERGGDGRCSCSQGNPTGCGCPPLPFTKSGHIGYMITARIGDTDDPVCNASGCADGNYFMNFNVPFQATPAPDPVLQLQTLFDAWRTDHEERPDAIQSEVTFGPAGGNVEMLVQLRDWQGLPVPAGVATLTVEHEGDSAMVSMIGAPAEMGDGLFSVILTPGIGTGIDRFRITADDGIRDVILMPSPTLCLGDVSQDCNGNGLADECEIFEGLVPDVNGNGIPDPCEEFIRGDCNADGEIGLPDVIVSLDFLFTPMTSVTCPKACDSNDDGNSNIADPISLLGTLFLMEPPPPPPFPDCGFDPTSDGLSCAPFAPCL